MLRRRQAFPSWADPGTSCRPGGACAQAVGSIQYWYVGWPGPACWRQPRGRRGLDLCGETWMLARPPLPALTTAPGGAKAPAATTGTSWAARFGQVVLQGGVAAIPRALYL